MEAGLVPPNWVEKVPGRPLLFATFRDAVTAKPSGSADAELKQGIRLLNTGGKLVRDSILVTPAPNWLLIARRGTSVAVAKNPFGRPSRFRIGPNGRIYYGRGIRSPSRSTPWKGSAWEGFQCRTRLPR